MIEIRVANVFPIPDLPTFDIFTVGPGAHIRGGVGGCDTSPSLAENCKKSVQNSFKIVEKVGPISQFRDV